MPSITSVSGNISSHNDETHYKHTLFEIKAITDELLRIVNFDLHLIEEEFAEDGRTDCNEIVLDLSNPFSFPFGIPEEAKPALVLLMHRRGYRIVGFKPDPAIHVAKNRFNNLF